MLMAFFEREHSIAFLNTELQEDLFSSPSYQQTTCTENNCTESGKHGCKLKKTHYCFPKHRRGSVNLMDPPLTGLRTDLRASAAKW